jgi:hypothetical protein
MRIRALSLSAPRPATLGIGAARCFHQRDKFQAAWAVAFPGRHIHEASQIQPEEVTRGPWLVILTRMGATREETTDILERVGRRW